MPFDTDDPSTHTVAACAEWLYRFGYERAAALLDQGAHQDAVRFSFSLLLDGEPFSRFVWAGVEDALAGRPAEWDAC